MKNLKILIPDENYYFKYIYIDHKLRGFIRDINRRNKTININVDSDRLKDISSKILEITGVEFCLFTQLKIERNTFYKNHHSIVLSDGESWATIGFIHGELQTDFSIEISDNISIQEIEKIISNFCTKNMINYKIVFLKNSFYLE